MADAQITPGSSPVRKAECADADVTGDGFEEEAVCAVCLDGTSTEQNPIVFCDGCDMAVHAECYGYPLTCGVPEGEWLCTRCEWQAHSQPCALCGKLPGAMKRTTDGRWAHLACAMWIPEVFFHDGEGREPIDYHRVPASRFANACSYCSTKAGATVECAEPGCATHFHVPCGLRQGVLMEYKQSSRKSEPDIIVCFCAKHAAAARKKQNWKMKFYAKHS